MYSHILAHRVRHTMHSHIRKCTPHTNAHLRTMIQRPKFSTTLNVKNFFYASKYIDMLFNVYVFKNTIIALFGLKNGCIVCNISPPIRNLFIFSSRKTLDRFEWKQKFEIQSKQIRRK